jgi:hypothetical protein
MSIKLYLIIITHATNVRANELPNLLGLGDLKPQSQITLAQAQYCKSLVIGNYGDKIIIVSDKLVFQFYEEMPSPFEKRLCALFPDSEIAVLTLNSTVDLYGFSLIKDKHRVRVKSGTGEEKYLDTGTHLPEETELLNRPLFTPDEMHELKKEYPDKTSLDGFLDKELGIKTVYQLTRRYLNVDIDQDASDFNNIYVTLYE